MATLTEQQRKEQQQLALGLIVGAAVLSLPALILALILRLWASNERKRWLVLALATLLGIGGLYLFHDAALGAAHALYLAVQQRQWSMLWPSVWRLWLWALPITPLLTLMLNSVLPVSAEEEERRKVAETVQQDQRRSRQAEKKTTSAPDDVHGAAVLGAIASGDLHDWTRKGWLTYPRDVLERHLVVVGGSGSGKTETLLRLAYLAAKVYGWQVLYLDAKGDRATAERFGKTMRAAGQRHVALFPDMSYDAWRGDPQQLLNRLLAVEEFTEPYYKNVAKLVLNLAVSAPAGPPRDSTELLRRLDLRVLADLYKGLPEVRALERLSRNDVAGVYLRYSAFFGAFGDALDGVWAYEDVDAAYILLEGLALKEEAQSAGRLLLEDWAQYVARRKMGAQRTLLIVDEWSALAHGGADAANLFERVRSFGASVIVSSQSYSGLGREADRMLDAAAALVVHACADPERLVERAGSRRRFQRSIQVTDQGPTGRSTLRPEDAPRVDGDQVRQLQQGECVVIAGGHAARVRVARAPMIEGESPIRWVPAGANKRRREQPHLTVVQSVPSASTSAPTQPVAVASVAQPVPVPVTPPVLTAKPVVAPASPPLPVTPAQPTSTRQVGSAADNHTPIESDF